MKMNRTQGVKMKIIKLKNQNEKNPKLEWPKLYVSHNKTIQERKQ